MSAFRFHAIVKHFLSSKNVNVGFLTGVVKECSWKMCAHVSSIRRKKQVPIKLTVSETRWLCLEAFDRKLRRHGRLYAQLLTAIRQLKAECQSELSSGQLQHLRSWIGNRLPRSFRRMKDSL